MNPQDILSMISRVGDPPNRRQPQPERSPRSNTDDPIFNILCSIAGGVLGGPAGMAIGGIAGTALSTIFSQNPRQQSQRLGGNPRSSSTSGPMSRSRLSDIIENQMNDEQRRILAQMVRQILRENPSSNSNLGGEQNFLENENMSNTLISQVLSVAQNMGQSRNSGRPRLGSSRSAPRNSQNGGCGGGCGCSRRGSCS